MQNPDFGLKKVSALVLAGGRGSRMGGVDKGLTVFRGLPLAHHALQRLAAQTAGPLHCVTINANRNAADYAALGARVVGHGQVKVVGDTVEGFAGPLAGFLVGLARCESPYLLTVPCDSPLFPLDLARRLLAALVQADADIAMASAPDGAAGSAGSAVVGSGGEAHKQPVFCLLKATLHDSLAEYLARGGRKIGAWAAEHHLVVVPFDTPHDDPLAFANANTLDDLRALEQASQP